MDLRQMLINRQLGMLHDLLRGVTILGKAFLLAMRAILQSSLEIVLIIVRQSNSDKHEL